jgi:hypothetical protein
MRRHKEAATVLMLACAAATLAVSQETPTRLSRVPPSDRLGLEVHVTRDAATAGMYVCEAVVTDLKSGAVLSRPRVQVRAGSSAEMTAGVQPRSADAQSAIELSISVSITTGGNVADYAVDYRRGGELYFTQKVKFQLEAP